MTDLPFFPAWFPAWLRRPTVSGYIVLALLLGPCFAPQPAAAAAGPFLHFSGHWSGTGTLRQSNGPIERIRCTANYRARGSTGHDVDLQLRCVSQTYNFDLVGQFQADEGSNVTGRWSEQTRNIGGTAIGRARGDRLQVHAEGGAFTANLSLATRGRRQSVTLTSQGGGQAVSASITLHRN